MVEKKSALTGFFSDSYTHDQSLGKVIGTKSSTGVLRKGIDIEGAIAIDNQALRIKPLIQPGWGRSGIAYGPYDRANGLTFATVVLNGHNTSQSGHILDSLIRRIMTWLRGSKVDQPLYQVIPKSLIYFLTRSQSKQHIWRRFQYWSKFASKSPEPDVLYENMAVGWFPEEVPTNPLKVGNTFVMHAANHENGELWARVGGHMLSVFRGLQNLPIYFIAVLREQGAAYYIASLPSADGTVPYPAMRPVAIDPFSQDQSVYAGIYQSVQEEIGFWVDTRVYCAQVQHLSELSTWYGTAHVADSLVGNQALSHSKAEVGGDWALYGGEYQRTGKGACSSSERSQAVLTPRLPSGLIHTLIDTSETATTAGIVWRFQDESNYWCFLIGAEECQLQIQYQGSCKTIAVSSQWCLTPNAIHSLQILDNGSFFSLHLNGQLIFGKPFANEKLN
jgi:hypothetical protein